MVDRMNAKNTLRCNLRPQLEKGKTAKGCDLCAEWLKEKWLALLNAHYECEVPGPSACLQDALHMITTGKVRITCLGAKKEEGKEARTMSELEKHVIKEWYDAKDTELVEKRGELYMCYEFGTTLRKIWYQSGTNLVPIWYKFHRMSEC